MKSNTYYSLITFSRHSTPLHFAAGYNRVAVVEYLLSKGADVHAKDKGYTIVVLNLQETEIIFL